MVTSADTVKSTDTSMAYCNALREAEIKTCALLVKAKAKLIAGCEEDAQDCMQQAVLISANYQELKSMVWKKIRQTLGMMR